MPIDSSIALTAYKLVEGDDRYRVGDDGSIWSRAKVGRHGGYEVIWKRLKVTPNMKSGHCIVYLGQKKPRYVHRLVLEAFVGPCPDGQECLHGDGDPLNNRLDNLKWGTPKENSEDRMRLGESARGERHGQAKLTEAIVLRIVVESVGGRSRKDIAAEHGVTVGNVQAILEGRSWGHVTGLPPYQSRKRRRKTP
jgi:hypothetical protein